MIMNRRRHKRVVLVSAITVNFAGEYYRTVTSQNISLGGMCVKSHKKFPENQEGSVTVTVKCGDTFVNFSSQFQIRWIDPTSRYCYGIEFVNLDEINRETIERIISFLS